MLDIKMLKAILENGNDLYTEVFKVIFGRSLVNSKGKSSKYLERNDLRGV